MNLARLASIIGEVCVGDGEVEIIDVAALDEAGEAHISFVTDLTATSLAHMSASQATALVLPEGLDPDRPAIIAKNPRLAFARIMTALRPEPKISAAIHATAVIDSTARLGSDVSVGPCAVIGAGTVVGEGAAIGAGVKIGSECSIGARTRLFDNVVIYERCQIGADCRIHAGTVIGSDGYGYVQDELGEHFKTPQTGTVLIEDLVEIGANACIDRATLGVTRIGRGAKIDNLVQIAHNCDIGKNVIIAGLSGIAGSTRIADGVMIGGTVGVSDNIEIGPGIMVAGGSSVYSSLTEPGVYSGPVAMGHTQFKRFMLSGKRIDRLEKKIKSLIARLGGGEP